MWQENLVCLHCKAWFILCAFGEVLMSVQLINKTSIHMNIFPSCRLTFFLKNCKSLNVSNTCNILMLQKIMLYSICLLMLLQSYLFEFRMQTWSILLDFLLLCFVNEQLYNLPGGVLKYVSYTGMCRPNGSFFSQEILRHGSTFQRKNP